MSMWNSSKPPLLCWELQASQAEGWCHNIFDWVIVAGNFGQSIASPAVAAEIKLTTEQKRHIALAVDQLQTYKVSPVQFSIDQERCPRGLYLETKLNSERKELRNNPHEKTRDWMVIIDL